MPADDRVLTVPSSPTKKKAKKKKKDAVTENPRLSPEKLAAYKAWRAEQEATFPHEAFGVTWEIPAKFPASMWFNQPSWAGKPLNGLTLEELHEFATTVLGSDVLEAWLSPELAIPTEDFFVEVGVVYAKKAGTAAKPTAARELIDQ